MKRKKTSITIVNGEGKEIKVPGWEFIDCALPYRVGVIECETTYGKDSIYQQRHLDNWRIINIDTGLPVGWADKPIKQISQAEMKIEWKENQYLRRLKKEIEKVEKILKDRGCLYPDDKWMGE